MPRFRVGLPGIVVTAVTLFTSVLSILAIVVRLIPGLDDVRYLKDAIDVYVEYIRVPMLHLTGLQGPHGSGGVLADLLFFWVAFFAAVNVFIYKHEGGLLPAHIRNNHCQYTAKGAVAAFACVLPKLVVAFVAAPVVCTFYALTKFRAPKDRLYSATYLTIQPREVLSYLLTLFGSVALILLAAQYVARFYG